MHKDRIMAIVLFTLAVIIFVASARIPTAAIGEGPGPGAFPEVLAVMIAVLSVALWFTAGLKKKKEEPKEAKQAIGEVLEIDEPVRNKVKRILTCIALLTVYFIILPMAGFLAATMLFGVAFLMLLYRMKWKACLFPAAAIAGFGFVLFELTLNIPLPAFMEAFK